MKTWFFKGWGLRFFLLKRASAPTADSTPEVIIHCDIVIGGSGNDFDVT